MIRPSLSLTSKVFVGTAAVVAVVLAAALAVASASAGRAADAAVGRGLEQTADLVTQFLAGRERSLTGGARVFAQNPYFRALVEARRHSDLLDQANEATAQLEASWAMITDRRGVLLAKSDEPEASGDSLGGVPLVGGALRGQATSGFGVSRDSLLFQAVAVPIEVPGGVTVGVLVAAKVVDARLARDVKAATASELLFYARDRAGVPRVAAATLGRGPLLAATLAALAADTAAAGAAGRSTITVGAGDAHFVGRSVQLTSAAGEVMGGFVALRSREAAMAAFAGVRRSIAAAGGLGLLLALAAAYGVARRVTRPVRALAHATRQAAEGDYGSEIPVAGGGDEIGTLADAVRAMLADLRDKQALVDVLAASRWAPHPEPEPEGGSPRTPLARRLARGRGASAAATAGAEAGAAIEPGRLLANRYQIVALVGGGGAGLVYKAVDTTLGEIVAIKTLRPELVASDPSAIDRLKDEIRLARRISHRNVVRTHDIGEARGLYFITMEFVAGTSLHDVVRERGRLPAAAVLSVAKQLLRALEVAHEQGIIHRDIKPQNILLGPGGVLKVSDFGIARLIARRPRGVALAEGTGRAPVGTPEYMSPEQLLGLELDTRADIYAAGIVLHECLTGTTPFQADTPMAFFARKLGDTPRALPAIQRDVPRAIEELVGLMTAADRDARPRSAGELHDLFARIG